MSRRGEYLAPARYQLETKNEGPTGDALENFKRPKRIFRYLPQKNFTPLWSRWITMYALFDVISSPAAKVPRATCEETGRGLEPITSSANLLMLAHLVCEPTPCPGHGQSS